MTCLRFHDWHPVTWGRPWALSAVDTGFSVTTGPGVEGSEPRTWGPVVLAPVA